MKVSRNTWALFGLPAIVTFFLIAEHKAHVLGALPNILFVAFIVLHLVMHLFMHKDHKDHEKP
ncbi:MAG: DUF2933 domain-containing protein [Actinomycetota bacterium]|nr:DUF2933 domain-containing protein [Actinomycetota bacterium]